MADGDMRMAGATTVRITEAQRQQYRDEGYFILERVIPDEHLEMLRRECDRFVAEEDAAMDAAGVRARGLNQRDSRYFVFNRHPDSAAMPDFIFSDLTAEICRATVGETAFLFWEQFVVKCAEVGMKFDWHQDSGYVGHDHRPYLTCWCALDDATEENGTIYVLPYSRAGTRTREEHVRPEGGAELVGYHGEDPGIPVVVPAGSIAVFSSTTFHRSGTNTTSRIRRAYVPQFSPEPVLKRDGSAPWGLAVPFLKDGKRVR
jgi:ectoine hydroxylase-related dioxygenase (phytanoyl-CoA dioxygenase family)